MAGPWEKYQPPAASGPWAKYGAQAAAPPTNAALQRDTAARAHQATAIPGALAISNGYTLGHAGDIDAAGAALGAGFNNLIGHGHGYGMADAFHATKQADQQILDRYAQQRPGRSLAANVGGGLMNPASLAGGEWVGAAKGLLPTLARAAAVGGAEGGVAGGVPGAMLGAAVGPVAPALGGAAARVGAATGAIGRNLQRAAGLAKPQDVATRRIAAAVAKDVKAGADPVAALQNWPGASSPTLADLAGENLRATVRDAGTQGPARQTLARYRDQVAADLQDNALALTGRLTPGETRTAPQYQAGLRADQTAAADRMYPAFKGDPIPVDDTVTQALAGNAGASAISKAQQIADTMRDWSTKDELANLTAHGIPPQTVSAGTLDLIRRGLRDSAGAAYQTGDNTLASGLKGRASDLETALLQSPGFDQARKVFQGYANQIDGVDNGAGILTQPPSAYLPNVTGAEPEVLQGVQVGARQRLADAIGVPTEGATGVLNRISTATNAGQNLAGTFGDDTADAYRQGLQAEVERMQNANYMAPQIGSKTFSSSQDAGHGLFGGIHGLVTGALKRVIAGAPLSDAERSAIVSPSIGNVSADYITALLKARRPSGLFGSQYAVAPLGLTSGEAAAAGP